MRRIAYPVFLALVLTAVVAEHALARITELSSPPSTSITIALRTDSSGSFSGPPYPERPPL